MNTSTVEADISDLTIFKMAKRAGHALSRAPAAIYVPELQAQFMVRAFKRKAYDDNPKAKLARHLAILGPMDAAKSEIANWFLFDICNAVLYDQVEYGDTSRPTVIHLNGGTSWEKLRGGVSEGRISTPMLHDVDFCYASELFSFLGHTPGMMLQKIDQLNPAMQERHVTVNQLKLAGVREVEKDRFEELVASINRMAGKQAIMYNREKGVISYDCYAMFIFCSRHFTPDQFAEIQPTGFISRNVLGEWGPDQAQLKEYYDDQFGEPDLEAEEYLRAFNTYAWNAKYVTVNYPPKHLVVKVIHAINRHYWKIAKETGRPFEQVRHGRTQADIAQLMTIFAATRALEAQRALGVEQATINGLVYEDADADRVLQFRANFLANIEKKMQLLAREDTIFEQANGEILSYLQQRLVTHEGDFGDEALAAVSTFKQGDLVAYICATKKVSRPTAHHHIGKLKEAGLVTVHEDAGKGKTPILSPSWTVLETLGFLSEEEKLMKMKAEEETMVKAGVYDLEQHEKEELGHPIVLSQSPQDEEMTA